jgi:hypothetical protein
VLQQIVGRFLLALAVILVGPVLERLSSGACPGMNLSKNQNPVFDVILDPIQNPELKFWIPAFAGMTEKNPH